MRMHCNVISLHVWSSASLNRISEQNVPNSQTVYEDTDGLAGPALPPVDDLPSLSQLVFGSAEHSKQIQSLLWPSFSQWIPIFFTFPYLNPANANHANLAVTFPSLA